METFSALLALCEGNPTVTGGFPSQNPVTQSFGDLWRHRAHYDVTVMKLSNPNNTYRHGGKGVHYMETDEGCPTYDIGGQYDDEHAYHLGRCSHIN